jgi:hypothetical protein
MKTISVPPGLRTRRKWIMEKLSGAGTRQHALSVEKLNKLPLGSATGISCMGGSN